MNEVITIAGSPAPYSKSSAVLNYTRTIIEHQGIGASAISVRDVSAEDLIYGRSSPAIKSIQLLVENARAVIIATPVYKAAYSGALKTFLDLLPQNALAGKVVFPIATAGSAAHLLAIDYALKPVLCALGSEHILNGLYIQDAQLQHENGVLTTLDPLIEQRLFRSVQTLIDFLNLAPVLRVGINTPN